MESFRDVVESTYELQIQLTVNCSLPHVMGKKTFIQFFDFIYGSFMPLQGICILPNKTEPGHWFKSLRIKTIINN